MKKYFILFLLTLITLMGCSNQKPTPSSPQEHGDDTLERFMELELFDHTGLSRAIQYLKDSETAYENTFFLGAFSKVLKLHYDWKHLKPYLKGGKEDIVGKILYTLALKYRADEIHNALIEILETPHFLKEILDFFTSETLLTQEQQEALKTALKEKNMAALENSIDTIYAHFFIHFDHFYNIEGKWKEKEDTHEWTFEEGGFNDFYIEKFLEVASEEKDAPPQKADARTNIVTLITTLVQKYMDSPIKSGND
ncbi:MAG: hypothetical protein A2Z91_00250 [Deltaproteobacteria bacterium GWA2_38_16]|nr:MAG: hypothetical protein A2Z91_00250 [Deltaproteobacteria bacterium GWA2_38_16]OGQ03535.1 MAG: hypothetical protein A3D19_01655 [Deltaproteobacteria bacterium RIFCSPHIGHO2_02_FULL_38_15]OGQ34606.1 MAG: hypothetical protein A3A72_07185 [Deltaproteobacteria bacterium RIFCSPLOWO2_01_FULL_38_9]OGQ59492.1 MAG: hypothetical protein A3G92_02645 [Deltaproteobacteria bacterium RIFCSPLOWO2_12_FULL_38_8]HBQ21225.1 hypothetical protein [Deltaproteobacteria bacterium]